MCAEEKVEASCSQLDPACWLSARALSQAHHTGVTAPSHTAQCKDGGSVQCALIHFNNLINRFKVGENWKFGKLFLRGVFRDYFLTDIYMWSQVLFCFFLTLFPKTNSRQMAGIKKIVLIVLLVAENAFLLYSLCGIFTGNSSDLHITLAFCCCCCLAFFNNVPDWPTCSLCLL